jgi:hypothetical protein|nr:MAG TPA: Post-transcriptional regulator [Caudoviricetes sp.]
MKKRKLNPHNESDRALVQDIWDMFDDDDISTERLASMVADELGLEYGDVFDFLRPEELSE